MKNLNIKLPIRVEVPDYYNLYDLKDLLRDLSGQTVKVKELHDEFNRRYVGIVYIGKLPSNDVIKSLKPIEIF